MVQYGVAVVGLGIAGKVRVRDISDPRFNGEEKWKMVGVLTRRFLNDPPAPVLTEDEMLTRDDVNVVIVCTEPGQHEHIIRKALNHGKNVLVEYPVVPSVGVTKEFYNIAREKGVLLHEENIALLTPGHLSLKQQLSTTKSTLVKGEMTLVGSYNGWVEDFEKSGGPFFVNVTMIQSLYELLGDDLRATGGHLEKDENGFTATAKLSCAKCKDLSITVTRMKEKTARKKTKVFTLEDGSTITENPDLIVNRSSDTSTSQPVPGLFMQDFLLFVDKLEGKADNGHDSQRVLHCIQIAEDIHKYMGL